MQITYYVYIDTEVHEPMKAVVMKVHMMYTVLVPEPALYSMTYYILTSLLVLCIIICRVLHDMCNDTHILHALFPGRIPLIID